MKQCSRKLQAKKGLKLVQCCGADKKWHWKVTWCGVGSWYWTSGMKTKKKKSVTKHYYYKSITVSLWSFQAWGLIIGINPFLMHTGIHSLKDRFVIMWLLIFFFFLVKWFKPVIMPSLFWIASMGNRKSAPATSQLFCSHHTKLTVNPSVILCNLYFWT